MRLQDAYTQCRTKILSGEYTDHIGPLFDILKALGATEKMALMVTELENICRSAPRRAYPALLREVEIHYGVSAPAPTETAEADTDDLPFGKDHELIDESPPEGFDEPPETYA